MHPGVDVVLSTTDSADDDVRQLREALRRALGTVQAGPPSLQQDWRQDWPSLAELGVTSFCVPEEHGGFGTRVDAAVATAMELGAALHGGPYAGLNAAAHALAQAADDPAVADLLDGVLRGKKVCAFGYLSAVEGQARLVDGAHIADALALVEPSGEGMVLLDPEHWTAIPQPFDVSRACAEVTVTAGAGRRIAGIGSAPLLYRLLLCADTVGGVNRMLDHTIAYAGQRQAFGRPIGGFQVVQHRLVEHKVKVRGMALLVREAARLLDSGAPDASRFVTLAEVSVSSGASHLLHDLLQLSGAIGFTWEYGLHYYQRRAQTTARLAANPRAAVRSLARLEGWTA